MSSPSKFVVLLGNALLASDIGAFIGWGIPEEQAVYYDELLSQGSYVVLIEGTEAEINGAKAILLNHPIDNWNVYHAPGNPSLTDLQSVKQMI